MKTQVKKSKLNKAQKLTKNAKERARRAMKKQAAQTPVVQTPLATEIAVEIPKDIATGNTESNIETVKADDIRADAQTGNEQAQAIVTTMPVIGGELYTSVKTWNSKDEQEITLRGNRNILATFEYVPQAMLANGVDTGFKILQCSDNQKIVGKPFADSYGLVNNNDFIGVIESICAVLDSMGIKWKVTTTGTLQDRERSFISLGIDCASSVMIAGREFRAFLNCLNSIPSNQGCTVTFANNTFCVCCSNTFAAVLQNKDGAKFHAAIKHTKNVKAALQDIPVLIECYFAGNQALFSKLKYFSEFPVALTQAEQIFTAFISRDNSGNLTEKGELATRSANIIERLKELYLKGKGNSGETALDVFQAATEFYTHFSAGESDNETKQFNSSEIGVGYKTKNEFYQLLVKATQSTENFNAVARVGDIVLTNYKKALASKPVKA